MAFSGDDRDELYDDDYGYDDDLDEDDDDEDEESSRSSSNPFTAGSKYVSRPGSNLPGGSGPGRSPISGGGNPSRLPGSVGPNRPESSSSPGGSRPGSTSPFSSGGSSSSPGGARPGGSSPFSSGGGSGGSSSGGSRPGGSSPFSSGGSGGSSPGGSRPGGGSSFGSSSSPGGPPGGSRFGGGSDRDRDQDRDRDKDRDRDRPGASQPGDRGKGGFGSRFGLGGDKEQDKDRDRPGASKSGDSGKGGLGGFGSRFGLGGDKDKPAASKPASGDRGKGGIGSRFGLGGGDKDKPTAPKESSGSKVGGFLGGLRGGKEEDRPAASGARPGGALGSSGAHPPRSPLGGTMGGAKTSAGSFPSAKTATGTHSAVKTSSAAPAAKGGLFGRIPFLGGRKAEDKKATAKARTSKAPKVESTGISLDTKLDILGVALVLGSLALILSGLSATKGALTEKINAILSQTFGWGALAIPIIMLLIGIWLILRHFGDEAPVVDKTRLLGVVVLYVGALVLFQYIDSFSYASDTSLPALQDVWIPLAIARGSGGGWVGGELYYLLVSNFTELGGFFVLIGWMIVGIMLTLELGAAELAVIVISVGRSFSDAQRRRAQTRAARLAEQQAALPQITVAKPEVEQLPGGASPALPAPAPTAAASQPAAQPALTMPERSIPVTMGGRTIGTFSGGDLVPTETSPAAATPAGGAPPSPKPGSAPQPAGGFASRLRQSLPTVNLPGASKPAPEAAQEANSEKPAASGGIGGRLFGRKPSEPEKEKPGAAVTTEADKPAAPGGIGGRLFGKQTAEPEKSTPPPSGKPGGIGGRFFSKRSSEPEKPAVTATPGGEGVFGKPSAESEQPAASISPAAPAASSETAAKPSPMPTRAATKPPASTSPFAPKPSPFKAPVEDDLDDEDDLDELDDDFEDNDEPVRLGELIRPSSPRPTPTSSPFARPPAGGAPMKSPLSTKPGDEKKEETSKPFSGASKPFGAMPAASVSEPVKSPAERPKTEEDEELEKLANLPPARPKGTGPLPRPGDDMRSRFGPAVPPRPGAESRPTLGDRQDRLNAIRGGQLGRPDLTPKPDAEKPEAKPASATPPSPRPSSPPKKEQPSRPTPVFGKLPDDRQEKKEDSKPAAFMPTPAPPTPLRASSVFNTPSNEPPVRATVKSSPSLPRKPKDWKLPDYKTLLMPGSEQDFDREFLLRRARVIEETLQSFGAPGRVVEVNTGPVITQFGVEPDYLVMRSGKKNRVKVSAIAQLDKDLQLALGAKSIRIEAPVPGKGYVGVEVPNEEAALVSLRDVMDSDEFRKIDSPLTIALGQSVDGTPVAANLDSMPHLLVAGTTGSGKSVCVNAIISSLLLRNTPDKLKMIMIDPKRVELTGYNGIPHLVAPVVVDLERIVGVLKWVTREMDERYKRFSNAGARNIEDFNKHLPANEEWMPYIIVIIDELADLMMLAPDETERVVTRIAALARATGIHLVIATQRPSVDVVTGLIKANFPARIAFAVAGGVDSRVILDQPGAERLLGRGDMLYMSGDSPAPVRLQGVFVSDVEINNIARYWKSQVDEDTPMRPIPMVLDSSVSAEPARPVLPQEKRATQQAFWERDSAPASTTNGGSEDGGPEGEDEMYDEAVELVRRLGKASVSLLQRRLRIGYTRAARLIDVMEERGVVGPAESGSKPREVLPVAD